MATTSSRLAAVAACGALLMPGFSSAAQSFDVNGNKHYERANAYAQATGLRPLRASSTPELRFWFNDYMISTIYGVILSREATWVCRASSIYANGVDTVKRGSCRRHNGWQRSADVWSAVPALRALDEQELHCADVFDGGGFLIEGTIEGKRFALAGSNPDFCEDAPSRTVSRVLELLP